MKGKMLISVLILAVFVVGAGILLFTSPDGSASDQYEENGPLLGTPEDDVDAYIALQTPPPPTPDPTPTPPPPQEIHSLALVYAGVALEDFTVPRGDNVGIQIRIEPPGFDLSDYTIVWESSNPDLVDVVGVPIADDAILRGAQVFGRAAGAVQLTVTIYNADGEEVGTHTITARGR